MSLVLVGLSHETAPVALRERLSLPSCALDAVPPAAQPAFDPGVHSRMAGADESAVLSTCNRLEIYAVTGDVGQAFASAEAALSTMLDLPLPQLAPHLYYLQDSAAVEHLFRVASGIDSMILGEPQILGQVARAAMRARETHTAGTLLRQLFAQAAHTGKRARNETGISRHTTSVSHAAVRLARVAYGDLSQAKTLVIGAGEMAEQAALALHDEGARSIACVSRTCEHAERLASRFGGRAFGWGHLAQALAEADVVITATGAPHTVIHGEDVALALARHTATPLIMVDIAVPRDVAPELAALPGILLYDMDRVQTAVDSNRAQRKAALPQVEAIVQEETRDFCDWLRGRQAVPVLVELRRQAEAVAQAEVELMVHRLAGPDEHTKKVMALLAHRIVSKLLHEPTVRLKAEAANGNGAAYAEAIRELFALEGSHEDEPPANS